MGWSCTQLVGFVTMPALWCQVPLSYALATAIGRVKGQASVGAQELGKPFAWQAASGVLSVSERDLPSVIRSVREHGRSHEAGDLSARDDDGWSLTADPSGRRSGSSASLPARSFTGLVGLRHSLAWSERSCVGPQPFGPFSAALSMPTL